jgi:energy-converting hydrogenase Eha subunit F
VLKFAGLVLLVALILVGALMPLRYTARMHLPKPRGDAQARASERARPEDSGDRDE